MYPWETLVFECPLYDYRVEASVRAIAPQYLKVHFVDVNAPDMYFPYLFRLKMKIE